MFKNRGVVRAGAASAIAVFLAAGQAAAQVTQEWEVTFNVDEGALAGTSFTGLITYDQNDLIENFTDGVLTAATDGPAPFTFEVTLPNGETLTLEDDVGDAGSLFFDGFDLAGLDYVGDNFGNSALTTFDVANDITNTFEVFVDPDFEADGIGTFSFELLTETQAVTRAFNIGNRIVDDTDILSTPGDGDEVDENTNFNGRNEVSVDLDDGPGSFNPRHVLIRFNDIMGPGPNQVPLGSQILGAAFRVEITSPGSGFTAHRILVDWDVDEVTWNNFDENGQGGVQPDGVEAVIEFDDEEIGVGPPFLTVNLTNSLQAFADGAENNGFALLPVADGTDGVDFFTSEAPKGVPADFFPPRLTVELGDGTTLTFQEDRNGYEGTADTTLQEGAPDVNFAQLNTTSIDLSDGGFVGQYLLRFDDIFGTGPDQIDPATDTIVSATLTSRFTSEGEDVSVYELETNFEETRATWNSFDGGVNVDRSVETFALFEPNPDASEPEGVAGFMGQGMTVFNPGGISANPDMDNEIDAVAGVDDQFADPDDFEADSGYLLISRETPGPFAVRSTDPGIAAYSNFEVIEFSYRDFNDPDNLEIRVGVGNENNFWVSNESFIPTADWQRGVVDITDASQWTQVRGSGLFADAIENADRLQFRHEVDPISDGSPSADDAIGDIGIDRIIFCSDGEVDCPAVTIVNTRFNPEDNPAVSFDDVSERAFIDFDVTSSVQRWIANPAENEGWAVLPESTNGFDFDAEGNLQPPDGPELFVSFIPPNGCVPADIAEPFGILDGADVNAFITAFGGGDAAADLNGDGVVDGADVNGFITQFGAGCP